MPDIPAIVNNLIRFNIKESPNNNTFFSNVILIIINNNGYIVFNDFNIKSKEKDNFLFFNKIINNTIQLIYDDITVDKTIPL